MRFRPLAALIVAATLALAGCAALDGHTAPEGEGEGGSAVTAVPLRSLPLLSDPRSYVGPSTAYLADASITPVLPNPDQHLPAQVISHDSTGDVPVTITATTRVVAMDISGSLAATVWALGFGPTLVGRDISTTFAAAADLPVVTGSGHTINIEAVIALEPDVVVTDGTIGPVDVVTQLRDVGIEVVFVTNAPSLAGAVEMAHDVAAVFGAPEAGDVLAAEVSAEIEAVRADIAAIAPSGSDRLRMVFLYLRGSSGVYYLFGSESGADDLITSLGGVDVASELGWPGMRPLTDEAIVEADPDLIIVMTSGLDSVGGVSGLLEAKPAIALTTAGKNQRFVDMADGQVLSFGPRSAGVLEALARAIYAPNAS